MYIGILHSLRIDYALKSLPCCLIMNVFVILLTIAISSVAIILYVVHKLLAPEIPVKGKTNIPGPTGGMTLPVIGDGWRFLKVQNTVDLLNVLGEICTMSERAVAMWMGPKLTVFIRDAKLLQSLLTSSKCAMKDTFYYGELSVVSNGVFISNGKKWTEMRRPLEKMLHPKIIMEDYFNVYSVKAHMLVDQIDGMCGKGVFNVNDYIKYCTLDIVLETLFGMPGTNMTNNEFNLPRMVEEAVEICVMNMMKVERKIKWYLNLTKDGRKLKELKKEGIVAAKRIIDTRYAAYEKQGIDPEDPDFIPENYTDVLIQLAKKNNLTAEQLYLSITDMITAGFDTTSIALSSTCLFLAMHPEYQEKAYNEQLEIMGNSHETPTLEELSKMTYLGMVWSESLRHSGGPGYIRVLNAQHEIDGFVFPEGTSLFFVSHYVFTNPKYWEKSQEFYPDHFLPENTAKRPKGAFLPFVTGARSCPGKTFATTSAKIILSLLLRKFHFSTHLKFDEMVFKATLMVESAIGYPVQVTRRT